MSKDRKCQTTGGLCACYCSVASQARYPVNAAQRLQAQGPQPTQQIWLMPFHDSLAELSSTTPRTARTGIQMERC